MDAYVLPHHEQGLPFCRVTLKLESLLLRDIDPKFCDAGIFLFNFLTMNIM